ncbi:unnamed protein product [Musa acuminata subsp. malaccensis]|uniref:(wild Malaysian banana) hypothetical protein n=1 Tax=Musa acuminata subsp. malaccensis TaxID=214687 RepID=A0A8D7AGS0_MUSAM|nr:unnamed protein product [Musa acuminata subsp. malaccensis]
MASRPPEKSIYLENEKEGSVRVGFHVESNTTGDVCFDEGRLSY